MARRSKMTDARVASLLNALRVGNTRRAACAHADISPDTFYRWKATDRTFSDAVEKAEGEAEGRYLMHVAQAAQSGTWQAAAWWLERRRNEQFGQRQRVDLSVEVHAEVERIARDRGLDPDAVMAELRTILPGVRLG